MAKISIHRALQQVKTLSSRIEDQLRQSQFIGVVRGADKVVVFPQRGTKTASDLDVQFKSEFQSITDLITKREDIKTKIAESNAVTKVQINGKEVTVQRAIEMKKTMEFKTTLLETLLRRRNDAAMIFNKFKDEVEKTKENSLSVLNGKQANVKVSEADIDLVTRTAKAQFDPAFVDPLNIDEQINTLQKEITDFCDDIDATLSESNAKTEIEVD